jgi:lipopolysaccharide/colanic/teichoic acid biosynthesis glycosyltransferase
MSLAEAEILSRDLPIRESPTVWGLDPIQLHDRFWAARGVCVVRPGIPFNLPTNAGLFLLTDTRTLAIFPALQVAEWMYWVEASMLFLRIRNRRRSDYRELAVTDQRDRFVRFERKYNTTDHPHPARVALTRDRAIAANWTQCDGSQTAWHELRRQTRRIRRETRVVEGCCYSRDADADLNAMVMDLVKWWRKPSITIEQISEFRPNVWSMSGSQMDKSVEFFGPVWIGTGRNIPPRSTVIGPAVLWDEPESRPWPTAMRWSEIDPTDLTAAVARSVRPRSTFRRSAKRAFDIAFALVTLLITLPVYPLIFLAIWLEDGRPFFYGHRRETLGGREFKCLKFRSMRKNADRQQDDLAGRNLSDGPQFFLDDDPRVTRVGRFLRKHNLDELPQFFNVLSGHMSVVGPRPSPRRENQASPAWREIRLSVRPGITGLWQVSRTRRPGMDFQEWVRYDTYYVQRGNWKLDLKIIVKTVLILIGG